VLYATGLRVFRREVAGLELDFSLKQLSPHRRSFGRWVFYFLDGARSPSGKARACKAFIGGSIPPRASNIFEGEYGFEPEGF
jgi:hypothetical protein